MEEKNTTSTQDRAEDNMDTQLVVKSPPERTRYRPGEEIGYAGLELLCGGDDVTDKAVFSVPTGTPWKASDRELVVTAEFLDGDGRAHEAQLRLSRKRSPYPAVIAACALCLLCALGGYLWWDAQPKGDTGSYIIPQGDMTDEEAQAMLDETAERSRITVSLRPAPELSADGALHVNFVVVEGNNGLSERLEVEQDGNVVYRSGVVEPGHVIEWGQSSGAHAGPATATVYAVDADGNDSGNPVSVEVELREAG